MFGRIQLGLPAALCALLAVGCGGGKATERADVAGHHDAGIHLTPDPAFSGARIAVVLEDASMDRSRCRFEWRRNGNTIADAQGDALDPTLFVRGDRIEVVAFVPGTVGGAERRLRAETAIANTPPQMVRASLQMAAEGDHAILRALPEGMDADNDPMVYTYRWYRNDEVMAGATGPTLALAGLNRGDRVTVEVKAGDGATESTWMRSDPFALENHPPQFTSQPTSPRASDEQFRYQAVATDPDGDPLAFDLVSAPPGMSVDSQGQVIWNLPTERRGEYPITLRVTDRGGAEATQQFSIKLDPALDKR
jgi:hypothetical protein